MWRPSKRIPGEARVLSRDPRTHWTDQLQNLDSLSGYHALGEEIWRQTEGRVDAFVHCVGTAASLRGVATMLKRHRRDVVAALRVAERLGPGARVVTLMADSGLKYLSTDVYRRS